MTEPESGRRRLVVWYGEPAGLRTKAIDYLRRYHARRVLCVTPTVGLAYPCETPRQAMRHLGSEFDLLVFDASESFDVNAFAALLGTLVGGGTFVLLLPRREQLLTRERFLRRFTARLDAGAWLERPPGVALTSDAPTLSDPDPAALTDDQARAVAAVLRVARGHRRRPLVLTADRGRGKSAALGIAAARLVQAGARRLLVTAPSRHAVGSLLAQLQRLLGSGVSAGVKFLPPDELIQRLPSADLLLVDEAAALPVFLLSRILERYARIVFATTLHGYEGSGRGFSIRFQQVLDTRTPQWSRLHLREPIRWAAGDPLEAFGFDALLMDAEPVDVAHLGPPGVRDCEFNRVDRDSLVRDEQRLREIFGLLVLAHYQTRPSDLQRLLDATDLSLWTAEYRGHVVAAALVVSEGGLSAELGRRVVEGKRRLPGHLLPQTLVAHMGLQSALGLTYARVMRIAVHPDLQRRGVGTALLKTITAWAHTADLDLLGTTFGLSPEGLDFWAQAGLLPVRVGLTRDAASGAHSGALLRGLSQSGKALLVQARNQFAEHLPLLLADGLQELSSDLVARLARDLSAPRPTAGDLAMLNDFAAGRIDYAGVLAPLARCVWYLSVKGLLAGLATRSRDLLVRKVIQHHAWEVVITGTGFTGRRALNTALRAAVTDGIEALRGEGL